MAKKKGDGRTAREGHVLLLAPDHITAASTGGVHYDVIEGTIEVPEAEAHELLPHGFRAIESE